MPLKPPSPPDSHANPPTLTPLARPYIYVRATTLHSLTATKPLAQHTPALARHRSIRRPGTELSNKGSPLPAAPHQLHRHHHHHHRYHRLKTHSIAQRATPDLAAPLPWSTSPPPPPPTPTPTPTLHPVPASRRGSRRRSQSLGKPANRANH
ncbi:hypothetical protein BS50DRAFT_572265 [Corynespora cassiicola Philippines]|uniref:Uncharacterized protein n=1 Tax=Corynespora cassiicola Philippines TaxID=1448308 RepID=A0A2T2NVH4_CORCC|nr:hypothetical protein BS50DRAFT_572265 [Corynespora cassiicola Philippines]